MSRLELNWKNSTDYSTTTTIRTNRYYIHILCWALDSVLHASYIIVYECTKGDIGPICWKSYLSENTGRHYFQVELGIALLNRAIELEDWNGVSPKPAWMRQTTLVPCDCKMCYFCLNDFTNVIAHKVQLQTANLHSSFTTSVVSVFECTVHSCNAICVGVQNKTAAGCRLQVLLQKPYRCRWWGQHNECKGKEVTMLQLIFGLWCGSKESVCETCWPVYDLDVSD